MKKKISLFVVVFLVVGFSLAYNLIEKPTVSTNEAISIDIQQELRNNVAYEVIDILGKSLPIRISSEDNSDIIIKHENNVTEEQKKDYRIIKLVKDPIIIFGTGDITDDRIDVNSLKDKYVVGSSSIVNFINDRHSIGEIYVSDDTAFSLVTNDNIFYGLSYLNSFTNNELNYIKIMNINNLDYTSSSYPLYDNLVLLVKNDEKYDSITEESIQEVLKEGDK